MSFKRSFSSCGPRFKFELDPLYKLKCGLEIHTQLNTKRKLFSSSPTSTTLNDEPNTKISYFDVSLPGTQPKLNFELVLSALKLLLLLDSKISERSQFDRKHYFYADQPLGYQITQHYNPIAKGGQLVLSKRYDDIYETKKVINFDQLQIEQDTGRSLHRSRDLDTTQVDLNRANMALIEIVTNPDFDDLKQIRAFVKKFQLLLVKLQICTGEMETGAMRIDVNVNVNDHPRVELKNLPTTSAIISAVKYEYSRQIKLLQENAELRRETRGWNGKATIPLRSKETAVDYRYMPDPELPPINLDLEDIVPKVMESLPELPNQVLEKLMSSPYNCKLRDAMILLQDEKLIAYYLELVDSLTKKGIDTKNLVNWCCHELQGSLSKLNIEFDKDLFPVLKLSELLELIETNKISKNNAKNLLMHLLSNSSDLQKPLQKLIDEFDLGMEADQTADELDTIIERVISEQAHIVSKIKSNENPNSINFLLGQCMKLTGGKINSKVLLNALKGKIFS